MTRCVPCPVARGRASRQAGHVLGRVRLQVSVAPAYGFAAHDGEAHPAGARVPREGLPHAEPLQVWSRAQRFRRRPRGRAPAPARCRCLTAWGGAAQFEVEVVEIARGFTPPPSLLLPLPMSLLYTHSTRRQARALESVPRGEAPLRGAQARARQRVLQAAPRPALCSLSVCPWSRCPPPYPPPSLPFPIRVPPPLSLLYTPFPFARCPPP